MAHVRRNLNRWIVAFSFAAAVVLALAGTATGQTYEDCEQPPEIAHGSARLTVDEDEEFVTAHYTCKTGYRLQEPQLAELRCSIETDEWDATKLPLCVPDDAHGQDGTAAGAGKPGPNGKRKPGQNRGQNIQEETDLDGELAARLDLSCMAQGLIRAPEIDNGYVVKYNRRKKNGNIFLVAHYECDDYYELQPPEHDRLYCSGRKWIGKRPECISTRSEDDEEGEDEEEEEEEEGEEEEDYEEEGDEDSERPSKQDERVHERVTSTTSATTTSTTVPTTSTTTTTTTTESTTTSTTEEIPPTSSTTTSTTTEHEPVQQHQDHTPTSSVPDNLSVAEAEPETDRDDDEDVDNEEAEAGEDGEDAGDPEDDETKATEASTARPTSTEQTTVVADCGSDRGGCDHDCRMIYRGNEVEPVVECSCYRGFLLDARDGRTCHDIDECADNNGGCEQTCINKPGSYDCACEPGLQIDTLNGHTCIDINECLLRNGHGPCQDTCENRWASYTCGCEGLPGTRLAADGHSCEDDGECARENGGCSHRCLSTLGRIFCLCPDGLRLGADWKTCEDIDECQNGDIAERCADGCENTFGSYRCLERPERPVPATAGGDDDEKEKEEVHQENDENEEGDDEEEDEEEEEEDDASDKNTEEHDNRLSENELPQVAHQSGEITGSGVGRTHHQVSSSSSGEDDDDDELENETEKIPQLVSSSHAHRHHHGEEHLQSGRDEDRRHEDHHQEDRDEEGTEDDGEEESTTVEHPPASGDEISTSVRYKVEQPKEREDYDNENDGDDGADGEEESDGEESDWEGPSKRPDTPAAIGCAEGLRLNPTTGSCEDIDECVEQEHGCDYCRNAYGGYQCTCPDGFELAEDDKRCVDVDECAQDAGESAEDTGMGAVCSHECHNTVGSFECRCPDTFHLNNDRRTCVRDFCQDLYENPNKTRCSHECVDEVEGFRCHCPAGYVLDEVDQRTCHSAYSCDDSQRKRCEPGQCRRVAGGDYRCECPEGYVRNDHSCHDRDECQLGRHDCSHECHNTPGSYRCSCPVGLTLSGDGKTCDDVDECERETNELEGLCGDLECRNTYGSYKCVCPEGRELDEYGICRQMDLCRKDNGGCSHICTFYNRETYCDCPDEMELAEDGRTCELANVCGVNNGGCSHSCDPDAETMCGCPAGMVLGANGRTCEDVNECQRDNGGCGQSCVNFEGGYRCSCYEGFELEPDGRTCVDRDECASARAGGCDHNCHNTAGSYYCTCHAGYRLGENARSCLDVNECEDRNGNCSHVCINLLGGHQCSCPKGLFLQEDDRTCDFVDECELNNGGCSHGCHYEFGVVSCSCPKGFELDGEHRKSCVDVDECASGGGKGGGCSHGCHNTPGGYVCECPDGYELGRDGVTCQDVDECIVENGNCSNICINLPGGHRCACEIGYELSDDRRTCVDVDECNDGTHDCSHRCVNVPGAYECECPAGFRLGRNRLSCEDVDECATLADRAGCEHHCVNTIGSYQCGCEDGHRLAADNRTCSDVDECSDEVKRCTHDCRNTKGGFECSCPSGMRLDVDEVSCVDIDECRINNFNGGCSHICENTAGSFECRCPEGMVLGEDQATCSDIDECAVLNGGCSQLCINRDGGYRCGCHPGYSLMADGKACEVSNPCALRNGGCAHYCSLKAGRPVCSCREGYTLNKTNLASCVDHNECLLAKDHNCQQRCVNLEGSYRCECYAGYERNELGQCIDVNECAEGNGGCGPKAQCINTAGSSRCACPVGFKLTQDRKNCVELKDNCKPFEAPRNAEVRCSRSRHKTQLFYRSKCVVTCNKGFKLHGPAVRHCNGTGEWDEGESICVPLACPRLSRPENGVILPVACTAGKIFANERCVLHCKPGFKPAAKRTAVCNLTQVWVPSDNLRCVPLTSLPTAHLHSPKPTIAPATSTVAPAVTIKPYIRCPPDLHEVLPLGQYTMKVRMERPTTNVDWHQYVDSHPPWGKQLEVDLPAGETIVTFRARSPTSNVNDVCRVVIKIRERKPPTVVHCPESFEVQLERSEPARSVFWTEPKFESESEIKQLYKSNTPGQPLAAGLHYINYIATDADGLSANCNFRVVVKAAPVEMPEPTRQPHGSRPAELNRLENHESYLICPGKPPVRLDGGNYPRHRADSSQRLEYRVRHQHHHQLLHRTRSDHQQQRQHAHHQQNWLEYGQPADALSWHRARSSGVGGSDEPGMFGRQQQQRLNQIAPLLHVPQGCVVKNIRIKQKLARLRHQQRMLAQHLQQLEESPNTSPALIRQQHQRYNNLLRYYSSWDKVSTSSTGATRAPFNEHASPHAGVAASPHRSPVHHPLGPPNASHHYQQQHPRRWLRKRSRAHEDGETRAGKDKSISPQQEAEAASQL